MEDAVGGDETGGQGREKGADDRRYGLEAEELKRLQLLVQLRRSRMDKHRMLQEAILTEGVEAVRFLMNECGIEVNTQDQDGATALMLAVDKGHMDIVQALVEQCGANVNIQGNNGWTALTLAAERGHMDVVRFLVEERSVDVNVQTKDSSTVLMKAVAQDQLHVVRFLVNKGGPVVNLRNDESHTAIRIASDYGHNDIVRFLTPFVQRNDRSTAHTGHKLLSSDASRSIAIPPSEVELGEFDDQRNIVGDFRVKWLGADVVVKVFISDASASTFEQEVRAWQELRHPNVLKLYGICHAAPSVNFFLCEYATEGSLAEYTMQSSTSSVLKPLTWKFLYEAALGLAYLHERGIIHGDLRCSNILIGNDGMAKLSNFGSTGVASSAVRSMRWQAPEVLEGKKSTFS